MYTIIKDVLELIECPNGFFKNTLSTISSSPLTDRIYLKSDDDFVKKSFALPDYTIRIVKCKDTSTHNVLNGVIDNDTMDMINAGDIKGAGKLGM